MRNQIEIFKGLIKTESAVLQLVGTKLLYNQNNRGEIGV